MDFLSKIKWEKSRYFIVFSVTLMLLVLVVSYYKNEEVPISKKEIVTYPGPDVKAIKDFFFSKINSPFLYNNYEIKKGDTIQKILKSYKINNREIQNIIVQYKKYVSSNQLLAGNKIEITIKKTPTNKEKANTLETTHIVLFPNEKLILLCTTGIFSVSSPFDKPHAGSLMSLLMDVLF